MDRLMYSIPQNILYTIYSYLTVDELIIYPDRIASCDKLWKQLYTHSYPGDKFTGPNFKNRILSERISILESHLKDDLYLLVSVAKYYTGSRESYYEVLQFASMYRDQLNHLQKLKMYISGWYDILFNEISADSRIVHLLYVLNSIMVYTVKDLSSYKNIKENYEFLVKLGKIIDNYSVIASNNNDREIYHIYKNSYNEFILNLHGVNYLSECKYFTEKLKCLHPKLIECNKLIQEIKFGEIEKHLILCMEVQLNQMTL